MTNETLVQAALACGAARAAALPGDQVVLSEDFRAICESNACGNFGLCYMCPPDVGEICELMNAVRAYPNAVLYQTVSPLEDSFDYEGMVEAGKRHAAVSQALEQRLRAEKPSGYLHLSLGGCRLCDVCAKRSGQPCPHPGVALPGLESYGINVYATAQHAGLPYLNGQNTVTYFGMVLWTEA